MSLLKRFARKAFGWGAPPRVVREVRAASLTYLTESALTDLYAVVRRLEKDNAPGILIEAGCALGGSAIVIATAKAKSRPFYVYDVFGMIPEPSERDGEDVHRRYEEIKGGRSPGIDGNEYYGYMDNLLDRVRDNFRRHGVPAREHNVHFVQGPFEKTLNVQEEVAFAHIDGDWYQSVRTCLEQIAPRLIRGGVLVIDDYGCYSGCRTAVDEYFRDKQGDFQFVWKARLHVVRN